MSDGLTTDFNELSSCMVIIKNVPCIVCEQCGETVFIGTVARKLEEIISTLKDSLTEIAIIKYPDKAA